MVRSGPGNRETAVQAGARMDRNAGCPSSEKRELPVQVGYIQHYRMSSVCEDAGAEGTARLHQRTGEETGSAEKPEGLPGLREEVYCTKQEYRVLLLGLPVSSRPCAEGKIPCQNAGKTEANQEAGIWCPCCLQGHADRIRDALAITEAAEAIKGSQGRISAACNTGKPYRGALWRKEPREKKGSGKK